MTSETWLLTQPVLAVKPSSYILRRDSSERFMLVETQNYLPKHSAIEGFE